jgi:hypothetical protein
MRLSENTTSSGRAIERHAPTDSTSSPGNTRQFVGAIIFSTKTPHVRIQFYLFFILHDAKDLYLSHQEEAWVAHVVSGDVGW